MGISHHLPGHGWLNIRSSHVWVLQFVPSDLSRGGLLCQRSTVCLPGRVDSEDDWGVRGDSGHWGTWGGRCNPYVSVDTYVVYMII
ncbi:hypothetical protein ACOMHN_004465 [Nucella lapillus]